MSSITSHPILCLLFNFHVRGSYFKNMPYIRILLKKDKKKMKATFVTFIFMC